MPVFIDAMDEIGIGILRLSYNADIWIGVLCRLILVLIILLLIACVLRYEIFSFIVSLFYFKPSWKSMNGRGSSTTWISSSLLRLVFIVTTFGISDILFILMLLIVLDGRIILKISWSNNLEFIWWVRNRRWRYLGQVLKWLFCHRIINIDTVLICGKGQMFRFW